MHVGETHVSDNFSRGLVHNFYEEVVVHLMEGLVPDLNDTKCNLAHHNTTWNKRVAITKNNQQLKIRRPRTKIHLDTSPFIHFDDKYFRTEGVHRTWYK